jgi:uncharacterized membrane protein HdeD (DUF308 family)
VDEPPRRLDYAQPQRARAGDDSPTWLSKVVGAVFLAIGVGNLIALFEWREQSWKSNLFMGVFGTLAGFVFTIRPLYRRIWGRDWWTKP